MAVAIYLYDLHSLINFGISLIIMLLLMYVLYPLYVPLSGWKQIVLLYFSKVINYYFIRIVMIYLFHTDFRN